MAIFLAPEEKETSENHQLVWNAFKWESPTNYRHRWFIDWFCFPEKYSKKCLHCILHPFQTLITRWWFQIFFIFIPTWGRKSQFDSYFSNGLKPPTRLGQLANWGNWQIVHIWGKEGQVVADGPTSRDQNPTFTDLKFDLWWNTVSKSLLDTEIPNLENHVFSGSMPKCGGCKIILKYSKPLFRKQVF